MSLFLRRSNLLFSSLCRNKDIKIECGFKNCFENRNCLRVYCFAYVFSHLSSTSALRQVPKTDERELINWSQRVVHHFLHLSAQVSKGRVYLWGEVLIKSCQQINHFWPEVLEKTVRVFLARKVNMSKTRCDEKPDDRKLNSRPARVVLSMWVVSYLVLLSTWGTTSIVLEVFFSCHSLNNQMLLHSQKNNL